MPGAEEQVLPHAEGVGAEDGGCRQGWDTSGDARVKDEAGDVLLGHARQLVGEDVLQPHKPEQHPPVGLGCQRVADDVELDDAAALLQAGRLVPGCVGRQQARLGTRGEAVSWGLRLVRPPPRAVQRARLPTSGPSMAAGSVMVSMTSLTSSMGMSPMTRSRLASSRVRFSGSFLFSPAGKVGRVSGGQQER